MILINNTSGEVDYTITNNNGSLESSGTLAAGGTKSVPLSSDFTYQVCGKAQSQQVCRDSLTANTTVTFVIVNGGLQLQISA